MFHAMQAHGCCHDCWHMGHLFMAEHVAVTYDNLAGCRGPCSSSSLSLPVVTVAEKATSCCRRGQTASRERARWLTGRCRSGRGYSSGAAICWHCAFCGHPSRACGLRRRLCLSSCGSVSGHSQMHSLQTMLLVSSAANGAGGLTLAWVFRSCDRDFMLEELRGCEIMRFLVSDGSACFGCH